MRIIKAGTPKEWSVVAKCTGKGNGNYGCDAELEVSQPDLKHTYTSCMGRFEEHYMTFKCPCCDKHTDLDDAEVPARIRVEVIKQKIYVPNRDD